MTTTIILCCNSMTAMTENEKTSFEIIKLIISFLTPIIILILGLIISKKIERNKIGFLKEKEWQVRWSELFLNHAIEFNTSITAIICSLFNLQDSKNNSDKIIANIREHMNTIQTIDWDIQNFAQFATVNNKEFMEKQKALMDKIRQLINDGKGNFEEVRKIQFEFNQAVRKAHNEILKTI